MIWLIQYLFYFIAHFPLKFFLRAQVLIPDNLSISQNKPLIIAANHISKLDSFLLLLLPFSLARELIPVYFLVAEHYYNKWWLRPFLKILGCFPVKKWAWTYDDFIGQGTTALSKNQRIMIFPEGKVLKNNETSVKTGIIYLASKTKSPIFPLHITGVSKINLFDVLLRKKKVILKLGSPFFVGKTFTNSSNYIQAAQNVIRIIYAL